MKRTSTGFITAILTFTIGIVVAASWFMPHIQPTETVLEVASVSVEVRPQESEKKEEAQPSDVSTACFDSEFPDFPRIMVCVVNSKAINLPQPSYPTEAKEKKITGNVVVGVVVDEEGKVAWARVHSGHPLLQDAVKKVVCQARFTLTKISEVPVKVRGALTYKFMLE